MSRIDWGQGIEVISVKLFQTFSTSLSSHAGNLVFVCASLLMIVLGCTLCPGHSRSVAPRAVHVGCTLCPGHSRCVALTTVQVLKGWHFRMSKDSDQEPKRNTGFRAIHFPAAVIKEWSEYILIDTNLGNVTNIEMLSLVEFCCSCLWLIKTDRFL